MTAAVSTAQPYGRTDDIVTEVLGYQVKFTCRVVLNRWNLTAVFWDGDLIGYVRHDTISWKAFIERPSVNDPKPDGGNFETKGAAAAYLLNGLLAE